MKFILTIFFVVLPGLASAQLATTGNAQAPFPEAIVITNSSQVLPSPAKDSSPHVDPYVTSLEQTVEILSKTNEALNQRWTPLNVLLAVMATLFALITILWAAIFALGYDAYRKIRQHEKDMRDNAAKQSSEMEKVLLAQRSEKERFEKEGAEILSKLKDSGQKTRKEIETEVKDFMKKTESSFERLQDKTLVSVSGIQNTMQVSPSLLARIGGTQNIKSCDNCGVFFYEKPSVRLGDHATQAYSHGGGSTLDDQDAWVGIRPYWQLSKTLCQRCKDEGIK